MVRIEKYLGIEIYGTDREKSCGKNLLVRKLVNININSSQDQNHLHHRHSDHQQHHNLRHFHQYHHRRSHHDAEQTGGRLVVVVTISLSNLSHAHNSR